ncbi:phosphotransferase [Halobacillus amylolyticus]|uniref:phosphotransferase n=1 Tax=Halobacillus amylolyticus TaxID=2932259 RepID=UPI0037C09618
MTDTFSNFLQSSPTYCRAFIHGDLTASNILFDEGNITGIIDFFLRIISCLIQFCPSLFVYHARKSAKSATISLTSAS